MVVICLHSLVSQTDSTTLEHGIGKFLVTGKMEIREYKLVSCATARPCWTLRVTARVP